MGEPDNLARLLKHSEDLSEAILKASIDAVIIMDERGDILDFNPAAETMFGHAREMAIGKSVAALLVPARLRAAHSAGVIRHLTDGGARMINKRVELAAINADGGEFPAEIAIIKVASDKGPIFVGFVRDISERQQAEHRRRLLLDEMAHRGKNMLAVVQAIVSRTLRDHPPDKAREILAHRLGALARSHAALAANPAGAPLRATVAAELEAFSNRTLVNGPDLALGAKASETMALLVHELATNAVKHGALSTDRGHVEVTWSVDEARATGPVFSFDWRERDGPPVSPPTRSGFGRTVLEHVIAADFKASPAMDFAAEGLHYHIEAPLQALIEN